MRHHRSNYLVLLLCIDCKIEDMFYFLKKKGSRKVVPDDEDMNTIFFRIRHSLYNTKNCRISNAAQPSNRMCLLFIVRFGHGKRTQQPTTYPILTKELCSIRLTRHSFRKGWKGTYKE